MLAVAGTVAGHARQELRLGAAETSASQVQALVVGTFRWAAGKAADPAWPSPGDITTSCVPQPAYAGAPLPWSCVDIQARQSVVTLTDTYDEIPLRVKWISQAGATPQVLYGWVLVDSGNNVFVRYLRPPCTVDPQYPASGGGPCLQGG